MVRYVLGIAVTPKEQSAVKAKRSALPYARTSPVYASDGTNELDCLIAGESFVPELEGDTNE